MVTAVCEPGWNVYSETFIRAHIERLPGTVIHIYGDWPLWEYRDKRLIPIAYRAAIRLESKFPRALSQVAHRGAHQHLAQFLKTHGIQVVLAEYGTTAATLLRSCQLARVPLVAHFHGCDAYHQDILTKHGAAYREVFSQAAAIIAVSRDMERQLLRLGAPREKVVHNPYGVDTSAFNGTHAGAKPPHFLAVGRFVDKKAPHLTLLAFERVAAVCPEARLAMIGDGYLLDACRQLSSALGLAGRVDFLGKQTPEEVLRAMRRARAFVQHSVVTTYGDSEGTPVSILEAGAMALPVVSTRHGGIQDVVVSGETGFLVDERDVSSMATHMIALAMDSELAGRLGASARQRICEHFSMERSIRALAAILERARSGEVLQQQVRSSLLHEN